MKMCYQNLFVMTENYKDLLKVQKKEREIREIKKLSTVECKIGHMRCSLKNIGGLVHRGCKQYVLRDNVAICSTSIML